MKRFRGHELALGILIATIFWVAVATIYPKYKTAKSEAEQGTPKVATEAETNKRIADYNETLDLLTAFLVVANIALWWATWRGSIRQSRDMEASIGVATRAAENAEKALHSLEVPHVYPVDLSFTIKQDQHGAPETAFITISLKNFGRSPGFPKEVYVVVAVVRTANPAQTDFHSGRRHFMPPDVIGDKETFGPLKLEIRELAGYFRRIVDGAVQLRLLVHHRTEDLMDRAVGRGAWYV